MTAQRASGSKKYVLVPGGWHGGWWFQPLAHELTRLGHQAFPLTLTGLGERKHLIAASTNLDTHVEDVVDVLETERLENVILVGHSYGGMVITGAADRVPERVAALVYVDAYVPRDGDSCWALTSDEYRRVFLEGVGRDGYSVAAPTRLDPRATPHPLASFLQALRLSGRVDRVGRREYVFLSGWSGTPFGPVYERLRADPSWRVHRVESGHNVMRDAPDALLAILLGLE